MRSPSIFAVVLCAAAALPAAGADAPKGSAAAVENYKVKCQSCHMPEGQAPLEMMNLADDKWRHGSSQKEIAKVISEGVPSTAMLPFKAQLTPAEIADLAAYVRSFDKTLKAEKKK
jgi:cytochrome c oxidase cbb3-type subunit 3